VKEAPPTFLLFVNRDEMLSDQYKKYLADRMRAAFGFEGCPIVLAPKARPKTIEPVRKFNPSRQPRVLARQGAKRGGKDRRRARRSGKGRAAARRAAR
jgi:hypothetical protein